jgi:hypothetical protein
MGTVTNQLYITATLKPGDQSYEWVLAFWEQSSAFKSRSRDFLIETGTKSKKKRSSAMARHIEQSIYGSSSGDAAGKDDESLVTRLSPQDNSEQYSEGTEHTEAQVWESIDRMPMSSLAQGHSLPLQTMASSFASFKMGWKRSSRSVCDIRTIVCNH